MKLFSLIFAASALILTGCGLSSVAMRVTISGGEDKQFMLGDNGPERANDDRILILRATVLPTPDHKKLLYSFDALIARSATAITSIKVENVSDPAPDLLLLDSSPKVDQHLHWGGSSEGRENNDPRLAWLYHEGNTPCVYHFLITWADGKTSDLYQLDVVPAYLKEIIRKQLGMK